ncbi:hypothetical protein QR97_02320 [Streptomyces sp. PBH53]|uniref:hypothetical protein n=1 Tax=Streptomyces sp. PBH53 TaxID=1577075 RepID=UPI0006556B35|nr:hypothetical protein [Streptomyces sp. PBH53]AKN68793.1 hypothetical protein QR97_02320 [Streptomyces sp. PBH53]
MSRHTHTTEDVAPGTVTLCVQDDGVWAHTPVDAHLWAHAEEEVREGLLDAARRPFEGAGRPVAVIRREDVEGAGAHGGNDGGKSGG